MNLNDWILIIGEWVSGKREGKGTLLLPGGFEYSGMFKAGLPCGPGMLRIPESSPWSNPDY